MLGRLIDRFGVQTVMNRSYLGAGEINRILAAEKVERLLADKERQNNWAAWAEKNPEDAKYLTNAMMAAKEEGLLDG